MKRSLSALLARGIDSGTAERLIRERYTLAKLRRLTVEDLVALGLAEQQRRALTEGERPPIPEPVIIQVLHASRWHCCVCRSKKAVILHHITPWHETHDHSPANLAVLCLDCHGDAHTKRGLAVNLTRERVRASKNQWEEQVRREDAAIIVQRATALGAAWDFINVPRLYELVASYDVNPRTVEFFAAAHAQGVVDEHGIPSLDPGAKERESRRYFSEGSAGIVTDLFVRALLHEVIAHLDVVDLTSHWRRSDVTALIPPGRFVWSQGLHRFRSRSPGSRRGERERVRQVYMKRRNIAIQFEIDPWWSLSNTAYSYHLRGQRSAGSLCLVRDVRVSRGSVAILAGCIAIGTSFEHPDRPPVPEIAWRRYAEEEEEEDDNEIRLGEDDKP